MLNDSLEVFHFIFLFLRYVVSFVLVFISFCLRHRIIFGFFVHVSPSLACERSTAGFVRRPPNLDRGIGQEVISVEYILRNIIIINMIPRRPLFGNGSFRPTKQSAVAFRRRNEVFDACKKASIRHRCVLPAAK